MSPTQLPGFEKAPERPEFRRRPAWDRLRHRPKALIVAGAIALVFVAVWGFKATAKWRQQAGDTRVLTSMKAFAATPEFETSVVQPLREYLIKNLPLGVRPEHLAAQIARVARHDPAVATRPPEPRKLNPPLDRWADLLHAVQAEGVDVYGLVYRLRDRRLWLHSFIVARLREAETKAATQAQLEPLWKSTKPNELVMNSGAMMLAEQAVLRSLGATGEELAAILFLADCCEQLRETAAKGA